MMLGVDRTIDLLEAVVGRLAHVTLPRPIVLELSAASRCTTTQLATTHALRETHTTTRTPQRSRHPHIQ